MIIQAQTLENNENKSGWVDLRNDGKYIGTMPTITFYALFGFLPALNETIKMDMGIKITRIP